MTPEPLTKEKILKMKDPYGHFNLYYIEAVKEMKENLVLVKDVKSAVQWLLKEIEKEIWKHEKTAESFLNDGNTRAKELHAGISEGLEIAKDLIKKSFEGVI